MNRTIQEMQTNIKPQFPGNINVSFMCSLLDKQQTPLIIITKLKILSLPLVITVKTSMQQQTNSKNIICQYRTAPRSLYMGAEIFICTKIIPPAFISRESKSGMCNIEIRI